MFSMVVSIMGCGRIMLKAKTNQTMKSQVSKAKGSTVSTAALPIVSEDPVKTSSTPRIR